MSSKSMFMTVIMALIGLGAIFTMYHRAYAEEIKTGVLSIDYNGAPGPLFAAANIYPGYQDTRSIVVTNNGKVSHSFSIAVSGNLGTLSQGIIIEPVVLNTVVWSKTLFEIAKNPESNIIVNSISPSGSANIQIRAKLPESAGNEYQGTTTLSFNFVMGNEINDQLEPTDDSGQIGDSGASTQATGGFSGLFARAVNGLQNISDTNTEQQQASNTGEVKGVKTDNETNGSTEGEQSNNRQVCFWWWMLLALYVLFLAAYGYLVRKKQIIYAWAWPIFVGAVLYLVHWISHDYYTLSKWCNYFVLIEIVLVAIYYLQASIWKEKAAK